MIEKRYSHDTIVIVDHLKKDLIYIDGKEDLLELTEYVDRLQEENEQLKSTLKELKEIEDYQYSRIEELSDENKKLKSQLYCDDEEGVCIKCEHHYLVKNDEAELGYYNSRCRKGHYECAKISLKYCEDFEIMGKAISYYTHGRCGE